MWSSSNILCHTLHIALTLYPGDVFMHVYGCLYVVNLTESLLTYDYAVWSDHINTLQWRHNGRDGVSNPWHLDCLVKCFFMRKISIPPELVFKTWDSKCLALIAQMVRAFGMNPKFGVWVPLRSRHFLSQKLWHFHKNIRSCVENECCCPRTGNSSNVKFTSKISIPPEPVFKTRDSKCLALIAQMVRAFGMNPKVGGSSPAQVETFLSKKTWNFHKNIRSCVENECCCPRTINSSNFNFTSKISIPPEPVFRTWDSKCLALIAQMVRAFGMNPKVGDSSPSQVETFSVSKTLTLSQEHPFVCRKWMLLPAHSQQFKC